MSESPPAVVRSVQVFDPADPGVTLGDIDRIEEGILWEEKTAFYSPDPDRWVQRHITQKLVRYLEMRKHLPGYEHAPVGFDFSRPVSDELRHAVELEIERLRPAYPGVELHLVFRR